MKSDLRPLQSDNKTVSIKAGRMKAEEIGAIRYIECCAWNKTDISQLKETISTVLEEQLLKKKKDSQSCCVM